MKNNKVFWLGILCCLVYFSGYLTRINYAAALAEIVNDLNISKQIASIAITGSFITYGLGQTISGLLGDAFKPRKLVTFGLICTSLINLSMVFLPNITWMNILWCFNGFFQSMLWPPLFRLMSENMSVKECSRWVFWINSTISIATIAVYIIVPIAIKISGWRLSFIISALFGIVTTFLWTISTLKVKEEKRTVTEKPNENAAKLSKSTLLLLMPILFVILLHGILRDGLPTWMPIYINEVFDMSVSTSVLSTAILPLFSVLTNAIAMAVYNKLLNELKTSSLFFAISFVGCVIISILFSKSFVICILMAAIVTGCMHGCNLMLVCQLPLRFTNLGRVSTISGVLNTFTYIGSAISSFGFATLADNFGWRATTVSWTVISFIAAIICILLIRKWKNFCKQ